MEQTIDNIKGSQKNLSHSDKLEGIISSPGDMFSKLVKQPSKTADWLLPLLILILMAIASNFLIMTNPSLKHQVIDKQMEVIEERIGEAVAAGQISREAASQRLDMIRENIEAQQTAGLVINIIMIAAISFVMFFIVSGIFYLIIRFILKEEGSYKHCLSVFGLSQYINVINLIIILIVTFATDSMVRGLNLSYLLMNDPAELIGFLTTKIDPFSFWLYAVISIGFIKVFNVKNKVKIFTTVFGLWIVTNLLLFWGAQYITILKFLIQ